MNTQTFSQSIVFTMNFLFFASASGFADEDYGTSVRRGASDPYGNSFRYEDPSYGTSVRPSQRSVDMRTQTPTASPLRLPATPPLGFAAKPKGLEDDVSLHLPRDYSFIAVQQTVIPSHSRSESFDEDVSYGTSNPPGYRAKTTSQVIQTEVTYRVQHVAHKATGGYHEYVRPFNNTGYHLFYVSPQRVRTYMGWFNQ